MAVLTNNLLAPKGKLKKEGVTFYYRRGKTVMRSSTTEQPRRNTRGQFISRQRMNNATAIWQAMILNGRPLLLGGKSSYARFCSLMRKVPVAYLTKDERQLDAALLLPGIPVSDGQLPNIEYRLGEVDGHPALLTSLRIAPNRLTIGGAIFGRGASLKTSDLLLFYTFRQTVPMYRDQPIPTLTVDVTTLTYKNINNPQMLPDIELRDVDGHLALVGDIFADEMCAWALARQDSEGQRASSQSIVTNCTFYEQYTTEEALQRAAESYGGLTEPNYLTPDNFVEV